MKGFNIMFFFYGAMAGVPILLVLAALLSPFPQWSLLREILFILIGIGSIIYGVIGFKEVFGHG